MRKLLSNLPEITQPEGWLAHIPPLEVPGWLSKQSVRLDLGAMGSGSIGHGAHLKQTNKEQVAETLINCMRKKLEIATHGDIDLAPP